MMKIGDIIKACILLTALFCSVNGEHKALDESRDLGTMFVGGRASFDTKENEMICGNKVIEVPHNVTNRKFEITFARHFKTLFEAGGGTIQLSSGTYFVSEPLEIPEKCCIRGDSMDKTIIRMTTRAEPYYPKKPNIGVIRCRNSMHVSVMELTVDGNKPDQYKGHGYYSFGRHGLSFEKCSYAWFYKVRSTRNELFGFYSRGFPSDAAFRIHHDNCEADKNGVDGFRLESLQYATVFDSKIRNQMNGSAVQIVGGSGQVLLKDIGIEECTYGIKISKGKKSKKYPADIRIENTLIINAKNAGVYTRAGAHIELRNVKVLNNKHKKAVCFDLPSMKNITIDAQCEVGSGLRFNTTSGSSMCNDAIIQSGVCCPATCEKCGGSSCADGCCINEILNSTISCNINRPPCILD